MPRLAFGPVSAPNMPILASHFALLLPPLEAVLPPLVPHPDRASAATTTGAPYLMRERTNSS